MHIITKGEMKIPVLEDQTSFAVLDFADVISMMFYPHEKDDREVYRHLIISAMLESCDTFKVNDKFIKQNVANRKQGFVAGLVLYNYISFGVMDRLSQNENYRSKTSLRKAVAFTKKIRKKFIDYPFSDAQKHYQKFRSVLPLWGAFSFLVSRDLMQKPLCDPSYENYMLENFYQVLILTETFKESCIKLDIVSKKDIWDPFIETGLKIKYSTVNPSHRLQVFDFSKDLSIYNDAQEEYRKEGKYME
jgi:hypothetical protein